MSSDQPGAAPSVAEDLLLDQVWSSDDLNRCVVLGGSAAFVNALPFARIDWRALDVRERDRAGENVVVHDSANTDADADLVLLPFPADRDLARRLLIEAHGALADDGELHVAGANAHGVKSLLSDAAELFGEAEGEDYKRKHRSGVFGKNGEDVPEWTSEPGIAPGTWEAFVVESGDDAFALDWRAGVFPGPKVDPGTQLLIDNLPDLSGARVLDVGSGGGVIGAVALRRGASAITLVDPLLLAAEVARRNVPDATVIAGVLPDLPADHQFDVIVSNPPFHRGKKVDLTVANDLIRRAPNLLAPDGRLVIVANAFLAYDAVMRKVFADVQTVAENPQYHVLQAMNPR